MNEALSVLQREETEVALHPKKQPRLGFLGLGWIGRSRLDAILRSGVAEVSAFADPFPGALRSAQELTPNAVITDGLDDMLELGLDGIVIATPSAMHADQAISALEAGCAVFCQKPLARNAAETRAVIDAARHLNRLLHVDYSYRYAAGLQAIRRLVREGKLGSIYAIEMCFHSAYGPDKQWFYNPELSGGGCLIDLGMHLIDLALWTLDFPSVERAAGYLLASGMPLMEAQEVKVEDYAAAQLQLSTGTVVQLTCSWKAPAGCDARIEATFLGTEGGACFRNVNGSLSDFTAEHYLPNRTRVTLATPPDDWCGGAIVAWARQLAEAPGFDPGIQHTNTVAATLDALYDL